MPDAWQCFYYSRDNEAQNNNTRDIVADMPRYWLQLIDCTRKWALGHQHPQHKRGLIQSPLFNTKEIIEYTASQHSWLARLKITTIPGYDRNCNKRSFAVFEIPGPVAPNNAVMSPVSPLHGKPLLLQSCGTQEVGSQRVIRSLRSPYQQILIRFSAMRNRIKKQQRNDQAPALHTKWCADTDGQPQDTVKNTVKNIRSIPLLANENQKVLVPQTKASASVWHRVRIFLIANNSASSWQPSRRLKCFLIERHGGVIDSPPLMTKPKPTAFTTKNHHAEVPPTESRQMLTYSTKAMWVWRYFLVAISKDNGNYSWNHEIT